MTASTPLEKSAVRTTSGGNFEPSGVLQRVQERLLCGSFVAAAADIKSSRAPDRLQACVPLLLCPAHDGIPFVEQYLPAVTKDLSETGLGVLTRHPVPFSQVIVALWDNSDEALRPLDLHVGTVRHSTSIGAGFWQVGVEIHGPIDAQENLACRQLAILAQHLLPADRG